MPEVEKIAEMLESAEHVADLFGDDVFEPQIIVMSVIANGGTMSEAALVYTVPNITMIANLLHGSGESTDAVRNEVAQILLERLPLPQEVEDAMVAVYEHEDELGESQAAD